MERGLRSRRTIRQGEEEEGKRVETRREEMPNSEPHRTRLLMKTSPRVASLRMGCFTGIASPSLPSVRPKWHWFQFQESRVASKSSRIHLECQVYSKIKGDPVIRNNFGIFSRTKVGVKCAELSGVVHFRSGVFCKEPSVVSGQLSLELNKFACMCLCLMRW